MSDRNDRSRPQVEAWFREGVTLKEIARRVGRKSGDTVRRWLEGWGVEVGNCRPRSGRIARQPIDRALVERLYVEQRMSENAVAKRIGVDRGTIRARLVEWGIPRRGPKEANILVGQRMSAAERRHRAKEARERFTGLVQSDETKAKRALTVFRSQRLSEYERRILDELRARGIAAVALWPVECFNIDIALPDRMIAIEIHGGWHDRPRKRAADERKRARLDVLGWQLLVFDRAREWSHTRKDTDRFIQHTADTIERAVRDGAHRVPAA